MVRLSVPAAALSLGIRLGRRIRWRGRFRHHRRDSGHVRRRKPPAQLDWDDLGVTTISTFLNHLESDRHNSVRTRNLRLTAIRSQFSFAVLSARARLLTQP